MLQDEKSVTVERGLNRRDFLKLAGAGLVVFASAGPLEAFQYAPSPNSPPKDFNAYLRIGPDNRISCFVGKVELGQGLKRFFLSSWPRNWTWTTTWWTLLPATLSCVPGILVRSVRRGIGY